jgi:predicted RNA-binding protein (virulence factor B family)
LLAGKKGYARISDEADKIVELLEANAGFLPYHDRSDPDDIYAFFGMSKKAFKMATGNLFKQRRISFETNGIKLNA